jgi:hypothetical protein
VGVWTLGPIAGDRDVDELRIDLLELLVAETVFLGRAGPEILAEDIRSGDELVQDLPAFGGLEVERDALHAAIVGLEERARVARQYR